MKTKILIASTLVGMILSTQVVYAQSFNFLSSLWRRSSTGIVTSPSTLKVGIGTSTPATQLQVTAPTANATTTVTVGKAGQTKGSCLELYRADGSVIYAFVAAGATAFTLTTTSCK